jgi:hypothetical protein
MRNNDRFKEHKRKIVIISNEAPGKQILNLGKFSLMRTIHQNVKSNTFEENSGFLSLDYISSQKNYKLKCYESNGFELNSNTNINLTLLDSNILFIKDVMELCLFILNIIHLL